MKFFNQRFLVTFLILGTTFGTKAADFSDCLRKASTRGKIVFVVDDSKFSSASEAFKLLSGLEFINFMVERIQTSNDVVYSSSGSPEVDGQGKPLGIIVQKITAKIIGYEIPSFVDEGGMVNQDLAEEFDGRVQDLKEAFPAIIRIECPMVPGPGGRVGG